MGDLQADELNLKIIQYKGEKDTNLDKFVAAFDDNPPKPSTGKFRLKINSISLQNSRFRYVDENLKTPKVLDFSNLNGQLDDFYVKGANVFAYVYKMSFKDHRGLIMKNLTSDFTYTKKNILLNELILETENSSFKGKTELRYDRKDFKDFNNKVIFDLDIKEGKISSNDLNFFYPEFGKNQKFYIDSHILGTLNDLKFKWFKSNGEYISSAKNGQLNVRNIKQSDLGSYYCILENIKSKKTSNKFYANVTVDSLESKIISNSGGKTAPQKLSVTIIDNEMSHSKDSNITLICNVNESENDVIISWLFNQVMVDVTNFENLLVVNNKLFINKAQLEQSGIYSCNAQTIDGKAKGESHMLISIKDEVDADPKGNQASEMSGTDFS